MNLLHLKYALEVASDASMTKAAERLYMSQPNLSRAIRELEDDLGIEIFKRTPKGIFPTAQGEEFLGYARAILRQVDAVEKLYHGETSDTERFSVSVPRASYISCAFTEFVRQLDPSKKYELYYKETNAMRAVSNILNADYALAILRYQTKYDASYRELLRDKGLRGELVCEFRYRLVMAKSHPLAHREAIGIADLAPFVEIAHADPYVPSLPMRSVRADELSPDVSRRIFVFERASQMQLLADVPGAFMWVSPIPAPLLARFGLVERDCPEDARTYKDVLVCRQSYALSPLDKAFIDQLTRFKRQM
ncbi:MAG: LysR family transcriptional regulator [Oscillospiraceae bacterium]|nr:LysR family transcriptional regulator [Oscillospiraceae bacterium]